MLGAAGSIASRLTGAREMRSLRGVRARSDLARQRLHRPRPLPIPPGVLVIEVPPDFVHAILPLGSFYPILAETALELAEIDDFVTQT